jgi:hypothetical protein
MDLKKESCGHGKRGLSGYRSLRVGIEQYSECLAFS